jgi:hypothetical protein
MAYLNRLTREVNVKVAWLAPAGGLQPVRVLHGSLAADLRGERREVLLESGQAVLFDFAPRTFAPAPGYALRIHLYATTATSDADLELVARGADAVVAVARDDEQLRRAGLVVEARPVVRGIASDPALDLLKRVTKEVVLELQRGVLAVGPEPAQDAEPPAGSRWASVGPYRFLIPRWCAGATVVDRPPLHRLEGISTNQVSLTFVVVIDRGTPAEVRRCIDEAGPAWRGQRSERAAIRVEGVAFEGFRATGCAVTDPPLRAVETFAGICGPDLLLFTVLYGGDGRSDDAIRWLFTSMIGAAIVRRTNDAPELFETR